MSNESAKGRIAVVDEVRMLRAAACDWRLSRGDVGVFAVILRHADAAWVAFPGTRIIAEQARLAASNVVASITRLEHYAYLRVTRRGQRKRQDYQILEPPMLVESAPARKSSGFGRSAPARKSSPEIPSAPVDMNLSAPVDRNNLLLSIGTEGTSEDTLEVTRASKSVRTRKKPEQPIPSWLPIEAWRTWQKYRGKKFNRRAQELAIGKLETLRSEGHDPAKLIDLAIESGWSSFYAREQTKAHQRPTAGTIERDPRSEEEIDQANREQLERFGMGETA